MQKDGRVSPDAAKLVGMLTAASASGVVSLEPGVYT